MARPLKPLVKSGGYYPSNRWTPLVYPGGYTTANGGGQPEPEAVLKTVTGSLIHITDALARPAEALSVNVVPIQAGTGEPSPDNVRPISGRTSATVTRTGKNLLKLSDWETESDSGITIGTDNISIINKGYQETLNRYNVLNRSACVFSFHVKTIAMPDSRASFAVYADGTTKLTGIGTTVNGNITLDSVGTEKDITITVPNGKEYISFGGWAWSGEVQISNLQLELGSTASAYEPYTGNTYTIQLGDTVYGGTLDVTNGVLTVDRAMVDMGTLAFYKTSSPSASGGSVFGVPLADVGLGMATRERYAPNTMLSDTFATSKASIWWVSDIQDLTASVSGVSLYVADSRYTDAASFKAAVSGVQLCYELATPIEITLTPTQIDMLLGENNLWADAGDSTLTYYAEGEASTSEALGILLGGTYNNPGGADDVSDDEALGILLGGS